MIIYFFEGFCYNGCGDSMEERKLILFDMDGTLIDWHKGIKNPSKQMFEAFDELKKQGFLVMIASGRTIPLAAIPLNNYNFDGYIFCDGAHVVLNDEDIIDMPLKQEEADKAIALAKALSLEYGILGKNKSYLSKDGTLVPFFIRANHDMTMVDYDKTCIPYKLYIHCNQDTKEKVMNELTCFKQAVEEDYYVEFRNKKCSKATGLKAILEKTGIKAENTYFFGDGFNDVEIFKMVGHPYVMANAHKELHQYGTVCKSVYEDGVYHQVMEILKQ